MRKWLASRVFSGSCPGKAEKSGSQACSGDRMYRISEVKPAGKAAASLSFSEVDGGSDGAGVLPVSGAMAAFCGSCTLPLVSLLMICGSFVKRAKKRARSLSSPVPKNILKSNVEDSWNVKQLDVKSTRRPDFDRGFRHGPISAAAKSRLPSRLLDHIHCEKSTAQ